MQVDLHSPSEADLPTVHESQQVVSLSHDVDVNQIIYSVGLRNCSGLIGLGITPQLIAETSATCGL